MLNRCSIVAMLLAASASVSWGERPMEERRGLFDLGAVSGKNPVVMRVEEMGIEVPVSEFKGYVASLPADETKVLTVEEKRKLLMGLLDDQVLLAKGYKEKADEDPGIKKQLAETKKMLMSEQLTVAEVDSKVKKPEDHLRLLMEFREKLFEKLPIQVTADGYEKLKEAGRILKGGADVKAGPTTGPAAGDEMGRIPESVKGTVLATSRIGDVLVGDVLESYTRIDPENRPDLEKEGTVTSLLKDILQDAILADEAQARGFDRSPVVLEKMQLNRNTMVRLHVIDELTAKVDAQEKLPGFEGDLRKWYEKHLKDKYTYRDPKTGKETVTSFEGEHESIKNDYMEYLIEHERHEAVMGWLAGKKVDVDERVLAEAEVKGPRPETVLELRHGE